MDRTDIETLVGALEEYLDLGARAEPLELEGLRDMIGRARRLVAGQPRDWVLVLRPPESKVAPPAEKSSSFAQEGEGGSAGVEPTFIERLLAAAMPRIEEAIARALEAPLRDRLRLGEFDSWARDSGLVGEAKRCALAAWKVALRTEHADGWPEEEAMRAPTGDRP